MLDREFGPYRLVDLLGRGGMGEVWRARDTTHDDRVVALKVLGGWLDHDSRYTRRFHRESALAAHLGNPHIVPIHRYGEIDGRLYLDMQVVEGADLGALVRDGSLAPERAVSIVAQVAEGLDAAHAAGLVHRDVKPSNVLVTTSPSGVDHAYVIDFGIARAVDSATASEELIGTLAYMAPERFDGDDGPSCDVYALGCVLYEALVGTPPFGRGDAVTLMRRHLDVPPPRPSEQRTTLPPGFDAVIARALAKRPEDRFPSASGLAAAARAALASTSVDAPGPDPAAPATAATAAPATTARTTTTATAATAAATQAVARVEAHRWVRPVLVAAVAVLLLAGLSVPVVLGARGSAAPAALAPAASGAPSAKSTRSPSSKTPSSKTPSSKTPRPTKTALPLDARHQALLDDLGDGGGIVPSTCAPLPSNEKGAVTTAIVCSTAEPTLGVPIGFYRLTSPTAYDSRPNGLRKQVKQPGRCQDGNDAVADWRPTGTASAAQAGPAPGYVACLNSATGHGYVIRWGARGSLIEGRVQDRDAAKAYDWWKRHATVVPPVA